MNIVEEVQEYVHRIDPNLTDITPYQVQRKGFFGICKVRSPDQNEDLIIKWQDPTRKQLMLNEIESLERTANRFETPKLVKVYSERDFVAVLKTYTPGSTFAEIYRSNPIPEIYHRPVRELVLEFHEMGISGLDPELYNLILYNNKIKLFDFDGCAFKDKSEKLFNIKEYFDNVKLERIFQ